MPNFCGYPDGPCSLSNGSHRHHPGDKSAFAPDADVAYVVGHKGQALTEVTIWWTGDEQTHSRRVSVACVPSFVVGLNGDGRIKVLPARDHQHAHDLLGVPGWYRP